MYEYRYILYEFFFLNMVFQNQSESKMEYKLYGHMVIEKLASPLPKKKLKRRSCEQIDSSQLRYFFRGKFSNYKKIKPLEYFWVHLFYIIDTDCADHVIIQPTRYCDS